MMEKVHKLTISITNLPNITERNYSSIINTNWNCLLKAGTSLTSTIAGKFVSNISVLNCRQSASPNNVNSGLSSRLGENAKIRLLPLYSLLVSNQSTKLFPSSPNCGHLFVRIIPYRIWKSLAFYSKLQNNLSIYRF